jgi:hypothetical protein
VLLFILAERLFQLGATEKEKKLGIVISLHLLISDDMANL